MSSTPSTKPALETVLAQMHELVGEAEKLLGGRLDECAHRDPEHLSANLKKLQTHLADACAEARTRTREGLRSADEAVKQHPYRAMAIALGCGAMLGALLRSRRGGTREEG